MSLHLGSTLASRYRSLYLSTLEKALRSANHGGAPPVTDGTSISVDVEAKKAWPPGRPGDPISFRGGLAQNSDQ